VMAGRAGRIFERVRVTRRRTIPLPGDVLVKAGDAVQPGDIVARAEVIPGDPYVVDLQAELGVRLAPDQVAKVMLRRVGDRVQAHERIARVSVGLLDERYALSPVTGVIEFISHAYARVLIREESQHAAPVVVVNVAKRLDVAPMLIRAYMRYHEGDEVRQGAILAESPGGFGLDYCYAPATGVIEKVCTRTGTVTIVRPAKATEVTAYLCGTVTEVLPEHGAVISTTADYIQGVFGLGFEHWGQLRVVTRDPREVVTAERIGPEHSGAVLLGGAGVTLEALRRCLELGVTGLVTGGANHADLCKLAGKDIGVGITGQEDLELTVILTEGFGVMPMFPDTYELLRAAEGRLVSINGSTQVRAGVLRPEVVLAGSDDDGGSVRSVEECLAESELERGVPVVGSRVRLVRQPRFGHWGRVVELPAEPVLFETEARLKAAKVELEGGEVVLVPLTNLEVI